MSDGLISRQAAIDALNEKCLMTAWCKVLVKKMLTDLPSAEPEITRCHECAKRRTLDCPMGITVFDAPPSDGYCYKAERRI